MKHVWILVAVLGLTMAAGTAFAEEFSCEDNSGSCTISETGGECTCADGTSMGMATETSTNVVGDVTDELPEVNQAACQELLDMACMAILDECISDKGACLIYEDDYNSCICADGLGSGGGSVDGGTSVDPDDDPETDSGEDQVREKTVAASCEDVLAEECPNDPPNPADECTTEALAACNDMAGWYSNCFEETVWPFMIIECCDQFETNGEELHPILECLQDASCDEGEDCFPTLSTAEAMFGRETDGGAQNADDNLFGGKGADDSAEDDAEDDAEDLLSCSQGSAPSALALMMVLLGVAVLRRRENV